MQRTFNSFTIFIGFALALFCTEKLQAESPEVLSVYPTGSVKFVQQVTAKFSTDMVAMGDPKSKADPFLVNCNVKSADKSIKDTTKFSTRWADNKNWVLDFDRPLKAGVRCTLKLQSDLKDLAAKAVQGLNEYTFSTAGPALLGIAPQYGEIEPEQYFVLQTDGPIDAKSVATLAYFEVEDMPDQVPVKIIEGKDREAVIKAGIRDGWRWNKFKKLLEQKSFSQIKEMEDFLVLASTRRFPDGAKVVLHWPKGILSKSGLPVEEEQEFTLTVVPPFEAKFNCDRSTLDRPCSPILKMQVNFTRRLALKTLKGAKLVGPNGKTWIPIELKSGDQNQNISGVMNTTRKSGVGLSLISNFEDEQVDTLTFEAPFPDSSTFKVILPPHLKDEIGRPLSNQNKYPLTVQTDEYSPLIKFPADFGVLELKADPLLPVSVRNIEKNMSMQQVSYEGKSFSLSNLSNAAEVIRWYHKIVRKSYSYEKRGEALLSEKDGTRFQLPKPSQEKEFELVGIPLKKPGFYVVEMQSQKLGEALLGGGPMYVSTAALVTDLAVHFKKGRESSLVWVTQLSNAKAVAGATVVILDANGKELSRGTTSSDGVFKIGSVEFPCVKEEGDETSSYGNSCEVFAFAQKGDDVSFTSSEWSKGIETYRFNVSTEYLVQQWGPIVMHTVMDRMLAQPGDTVQMKHVLREHTQTGFSMMSEKRLPKRVLIVHEGSRKTYTLPFEFNKSTGAAIGKFVIPKDATLGRYTVYLSNKEALQRDKKLPQSGDDEIEDGDGESNGDSDPFDWTAKETGHFVVSEYRLPLMKAAVKLLGQPLVKPNEVKVDLSASYLSGGPAKSLKVKLRSALQAGYYTPDVPGGADYNFFSQPVKKGIVNSEENQSSEESYLKVQNLTLNKDGGLLTTIPAIPNVTKIQQLIVEMEYSDPNGEIKTSTASVPVFPADYVIGLRSDDWYAEPGKTKVMGVIADNDGKPQANRSFTVEAFQNNYITHRKRLVGGFYSYDSKTEVVALGKVCEGKSDLQGRFKCEPKVLPAGSVTLQAKTSDDKGRSTFANVNVSVHQAGVDTWWVPSDSDRIDILPEKNKYEPGEKAKLIIRTPYPTATALVTVEREGVLDSFVTEVQRDNPVIELALKNNYAPNVYVSALLIRGRVNDPKPTAILDLGRPSMKMGLIDLKVGWKAHELLVNVKTDKTKYRAREKAQVVVDVKTASGEKLPAGAEVAIAAVDESLMRLKDNTSWKILEAMMGHRDLAVNTSSAQNQVVGKRHFGSKAKAPGGDGGGASLSGDTREFFEPMLYWNAVVKLDSSGQAKVSIPLNDSMTSFRIVAVASAGVNFFGDGKTRIESSKDLIIFSGFAPLVREGDQIKNAFTLRNTTSKLMKVSLAITSKELAKLPDLPAIDLQPSEARVVDLPVIVPMGLKNITYEIKAKDTLSGSTDSMIAKIKVEPAVPAHVMQATLFQLDKSYQVPVRQPADAIAGKGGMSIHLKPTLATGLAGVKSYMEDYPYDCLEQQISKAIVLEDKNQVKKIIESLPSYMDALGVLKFFSTSRCGSVQLSRYVMNILNENGYEIPQETKSKLTGGLAAYINGQTMCRSWWDELTRDPYVNEEKLLAMETLSRYGAFDPASLSTIKVTPNLWKTETEVAWFQLLRRQGNIPERDAQLKQAENILRSRVNFQGSLMNLQGELDWEAAWKLFSSRDQEALALFGISIEEKSWSQDVGRMARGVVTRLKMGKWDTTMANAWGVTQLRKFSDKFEKESVFGETKVSAADVNQVFKWTPPIFGHDKLLNWPKDSEKKNVNVQFTHSGTGKPWVTFQVLSAVPLKAPLDLGYKLSKKITPVTQQVPGTWSVGDVANVEVNVTAKADQAWVVVTDPLPAGAAHLGNGLDSSSEILDRATPSAKANQLQDWPTEYESKSFAHFMSYAAYLPRGSYKLNYRIRLNSAGEFKLPPTRVEALYAPETFGELPNANWKVSK